MMAKARIAVVGAGLMGHGIAQVFALAGHEVKITDTVVKNLDTVASRIAANLRDLGEDESAVERVQPSVDLTDAVHDADIAEPVQRTVGGRQRYVVCVRYNERQSDGSYRGAREHAVVYVDGRLDHIVDKVSDVCAGATYAAFPEMGNLTR